MHLSNRIHNIYPELRDTPEVFINGDIVIQDNGKGAFIAKWDHPTLAEPTEATINAASDALDLSYKQKRANEYPPIQDQLDMIYHDNIDGTTTWVDALTAVKVKHPKPT